MSTPVTADRRRDLLVVIALYAISALVAVVLSMVLVRVTGGHPWKGLSALLDGSVRRPGRWGATLAEATPLLLVAIGTSVCYRAGLVNIGQEGQLLIGATATAFIAIRFQLHGPFAILLALLCGVMAGAIWAGLAGALLALGIKELLNRGEEGNPPGWTRQLDRFCAMPLALLLGISSGLEVISPDDLFLFAKTASALLASGLNRLQEALYTAGFTVAASLALLVPFLAVLIGREQVLPWLERSKQLLFNKGDLLVGGLSLVLAGYLGWQGIEGLQLG